MIHAMKAKPLRYVAMEVSPGRRYTLKIWEQGRARQYGGEFLVYQLRDPRGRVLFQGDSFGTTPVETIDHERQLRELIAWLTLKPGDTDPAWFKSYTPRQRRFARSFDCERLEDWSDRDDNPPKFVNLDGWE